MIHTSPWETENHTFQHSHVITTQLNSKALLSTSWDRLHGTSPMDFMFKLKTYYLPFFTMFENVSSLYTVAFG